MPLTTPAASDGVASPRASSSAARARFWPISVIALSAVVLIFNVVRLIGDSALVDAGVYFGGARLLLEGGDLYGTRIAVAGIQLPFTYPPFAAILFVGVFAASLTPGVYLLTALGLGGLFLALFLVARRFDEGLLGPLASASAFTAVATFLEPVADTLDFVQINTILLGMVALDCLGRTRLLPRGVLVGLATAIKLTPAVFVLFFLARRDWRSVGWTAAGFLGATGVGWLIAPAESADYWFTVLADSGRIGDPAYVGNQSLRGLLSRLVSDETLVQALWAVTTALVVVAGWLLAARLRSLGQDVLALCAVAAVGLLASPVSWSHHWVWAMPVLLVLWCRPAGMPREVTTRQPSIPSARSAPPDSPSSTAPAARAMRVAVPRPSPWSAPVLLRRGVCLLVIAYLILGVHWWLPHQRDEHLTWSGWQQLVGGDYVIAALIGLVVLAVLARRWGRPAADVGPDGSAVGSAAVLPGAGQANLGQAVPDQAVPAQAVPDQAGREARRSSTEPSVSEPASKDLTTAVRRGPATTSGPPTLPAPRSATPGLPQESRRAPTPEA
ncbi:MULTISPECIES: glycosyltransferase 87 family protein [Actinoalloteichus]|uniref:DUF2029 family protein n=1 Tax=Actinoalloteichus fjordicus TaxID=1612552 RepID=A0AAC9L7K4_9PSEU|nr:MULTISPECIES: glycosyltransferase 87 family protein [Actinoalloteichus]APU12843.1 putative DUF2029 family protein [Actinoalloteichus fjordicus]APU18815.1 putative DUF2029 family protein [Actinoalloteichus sp. GBA129-24]